jgi:hypothetical protein
MEELTQKDLHHHNNMSNNMFYKGSELMASSVGVSCSHKRRVVFTMHGRLQGFMHRSPKYQCCGTRTGTAGTVTFCLSGTRNGFGSGSNIK